MCYLPDLKFPGNVPPVNKRELLAVVTESGGPADVVKALLLSDDLLQRQAVIAGEIEVDQADLAVLDLGERDKVPSLPRFLEPVQKDEPEISGSLSTVDQIWRRYFHHAAKVAQMTHTPFLAAWVGFEVGLRNALAKTRAKMMGLDPGPYMVAPELVDSKIPFDNILAEWTAASNPLKGVEFLERTRWEWLTEHEQWYRFSDDEVAAYTAKLMLLHRWHRRSAKSV